LLQYFPNSRDRDLRAQSPPLEHAIAASVGSEPPAMPSAVDLYDKPYARSEEVSDVPPARQDDLSAKRDAKAFAANEPSGGSDGGAVERLGDSEGHDDFLRARSWRRADGHADLHSGC